MAGPPLASDGTLVDTAAGVRRWCFAGNAEDALDKDVLGKLKGMLKKAEVKGNGEQEYVDYQETAGPEFNWRLTATAIGRALGGPHSLLSPCISCAYESQLTRAGRSRCRVLERALRRRDHGLPHAAGARQPRGQVRVVFCL